MNVIDVIGPVADYLNAALLSGLEQNISQLSENEITELRRFVSQVNDNQKLAVAELISLDGTFRIRDLANRDGASYISRSIAVHFDQRSLNDQQEQMRSCELLGLFYMHSGRYSEALMILASWYEFILRKQVSHRERYHKGAVLVWMSDCLKALGCPVLSKRYLMLTMIEDSLSNNGKIDPDQGVYFRMVWTNGLSDSLLGEVAGEVFWHCKQPENVPHIGFPEWLLPEISVDWMTEVPSTVEANIYIITKQYIKYLRSQLPDPTGKTLERLAQYIMMCMPGCRTYRRVYSHSTDYDIVCSMDGFDIDFRSEFGRYFVCECKDWDRPVDFSTVAKFCRVLDSTKSRFGIIFCRQGISGQNGTRFAERERIKVFQDRGIVIVVLTDENLEHLERGSNLINILRGGYSQVRLDTQ